MLSKEASSTIFLSLWYDSTWDWTSVSWTIGKHSTHLTNDPVKKMVLGANRWVIKNQYTEKRKTDKVQHLIQWTNTADWKLQLIRTTQGQQTQLAIYWLGLARQCRLHMVEVGIGYSVNSNKRWKNSWFTLFWWLGCKETSICRIGEWGMSQRYRKGLFLQEHRSTLCSLSIPFYSLRDWMERIKQQRS